MNPYKVLGVSENATQDEIRAAYRDMVKKYHPDKYTDNPLKELANEKLKEINEAYEQLTKKGTNASGHKNEYGNYGGAYSGSGGSYSGPSAQEFAKARNYIHQNNLQAAKMVLDSLQVRNAEWYYLYGIIYMRQGWYDRAKEYMARAYEMEPGNAEYRNAHTTVNNAGSPFGHSHAGTGRQTYNNDSCSACNICSSLLCADCLCGLLGGRGCC